VNEFSQELIDRSGYLAEGFADVYDRHRPAPPPALLDVLALVAQVERPRLVVDVGCGTGLSTRAWVDRAEQVVGVEPNPRMVERARRATTAPNVRYVEAYAAETGLPAGGADLVTVSQAFHWMEPGAVLEEAARILRPGGVFAAYDYDVPPLVEPDVDEAFARFFEGRRAARTRLGMEAGAAVWPKEGHLEQIRASGRFRYARELVCNGWDEADADRICGLAESIGGPAAIFERAPEVGEAHHHLKEVAHRILGERTWPMVVGYRIRLGIV
jgi:SAM-dependent methyltransferase